MSESNAINSTSAGIVGNTGTAFVQTAATNHAVIVGGSTTSTITNVPAVAVSGSNNGQFVLVSTSATTDPAYSTTFSVSDANFIAQEVGSNSGAKVQLAVSNTNATQGSCARLITSTSASNTTSDAYILYQNGNGSSGSWEQGLQSTASSSNFVLQANPANVADEMDGTTVFQMTQSGQMTKPLQPSFFAYISTSPTNVTGNSTDYTVAMANTLFNVGTSYNTGTFLFTAPVAGKYFFQGEVSANNFTAAAVNAYCFLTCSTAGTFRGNQVGTGARDNSNNISLHVSVVVSLAASETVGLHLQVDNTTKTIGINGGSTPYLTYFSGYLLG